MCKVKVMGCINVATLLHAPLSRLLCMDATQRACMSSICGSGRPNSSTDGLQESQQVAKEQATMQIQPYSKAGAVEANSF